MNPKEANTLARYTVPHFVLHSCAQPFYLVGQMDRAQSSCVLDQGSGSHLAPKAGLVGSGWLCRRLWGGRGAGWPQHRLAGEKGAWPALQ